MSKFIKSDNRIMAIPNGMEYSLEPGKVYDLKIRKQWGEIITQFTLNGEMNLPKKVFTTKKDELFIKRVLHSFNKDEKNTSGVLLTGEKGTGNIIYLYKSNNSIYLNRKYKLYKEYCRLYEESYRLQQGKIGEGCDANTEQTIDISQGFMAA